MEKQTPESKKEGGKKDQEKEGRRKEGVGKSGGGKRVIVANGIYWIMLKVRELLCRLFSCLN